MHKEQLEDCEHLLPRFLCRQCTPMSSRGKIIGRYSVAGPPIAQQPKNQRYQPKFTFLEVADNGKD